MAHARHQLVYYWDDHDDCLYTDCLDPIAELAPAFAPTKTEIKYVLVAEAGTLILGTFYAKPEPELIMCMIDDWMNNKPD